MFVLLLSLFHTPTYFLGVADGAGWAGVGWVYVCVRVRQKDVLISIVQSILIWLIPLNVLLFRWGEDEKKMEIKRPEERQRQKENGKVAATTESSICEK